MSTMKICATLSILMCVVFLALAKSPLPPGGLNYINCTRPNEYYNCGSACQTECATLGQVCPIVNFRCNDACYCIEGYARNEKGDCIPQSECKK
ncbi:inducible metalloproteinase inhibitor protein-like [Zophobas morio]